MCKKVGIAVLAIVLGLIVVKRTWVGGHIRLHWNKFRTWAKNQVTPEQEIARLKMELKNLEKEDDKQFDRVAVLDVEVKKMERQVEKLRKGLTAEKVRLRDLQANLAGKKFIEYRGEEYSRDDLRKDALAYDRASRVIESKTKALASRKKHLALEKRKLGELKTVREEMAAELERLETALIEERQAQAENECCVDDSSYRKIRKDMEALKDRLEVLKTKRELKGEFKPVKATRNKEQDAKAEKILENLSKDDNKASD